MLPLTKGDVLVVNASPNALLNGATNPMALQAFFDRGVTVRSHARLHAKVLCTRSRAIVGSANASTHSQASEEGVVISTNPATVREIREFVLRLADEADDEVDGAFLAEAMGLYARRTRPRSLPGVTGSKSTAGLLRAPVGTLWITTYFPDAPSKEFTTKAESHRPRSGLDGLR